MTNVDLARALFALTLPYQSWTYYLFRRRVRRQGFQASPQTLRTAQLRQQAQRRRP
jgi:hypothetical protein